MDDHIYDLDTGTENNTDSKAPVYSNPRLPIDLGFTNLGLLMQLTAGLFLAYIVMILSTMGLNMIPGFILLTSAARSVVHGVSGRYLVHGNPASRMTIKVYVGVSFAQLLAILMAIDGVNAKGILALGILLMSWPLALFWITERRAAKDYYGLELVLNRHPKGIDQGIKGTGTLMIVLGASGLAMASWLFYSLMTSGVLQAGIAGILVLLTSGILVARSWTHVSRGNDCCRHPAPGTFLGAVKTYMGICIASACAFVLTVFVGMSMARGTAPPVWGIVFSVAFLMLLWPLVLTDRRTLLGVTNDWEDFDAAPEVARDQGLTALGHLLFASGLVSVSFHLATQLAASDYSTAVSAFSSGDVWLNFVVGLLMLWSGFELVTMSVRFRMAATCYGVVGSGLAMWNVIQTIDQLEGSGNPLASQSGAMVIFMLAISLILPLSALLMTRRQLPSEWDSALDS